MRRITVFCLLAATTMLLSSWSGICRAEPKAVDDGVVMGTEAWERSVEAFAKCNERIREYNSRNLLARRGVLVTVDPPNSLRSVHLLADGDAGVMGADGRVFVNGQPTVITYYLGEPKTITEVGLFSFNVDTRANQDYEVRFANNAKNPGVMPEFAATPDLTTGPEIIGQDRGGFHSRFVRTDGKSLVPGQVDWIQFRIWRTYQGKAGDPARTTDPISAAVVIELEVLGAKDDIVTPTPEELAYRETLRNAPKQPELVKRDSWFETMIASREALHQWECLHDYLAMPVFGVDLGAWHVLGPISGKSKDLAEIRKATKIDLSCKFEGANGETIGWRERKDLKDWDTNDLTNGSGMDKGDVMLLCRTIGLRRTVEQRELYVEASADKGSLLLLPQRRRLSVRSPLGNLQGGSELTGEPGEYQLLMELKAGNAGQCRFCFVVQPDTSQPGAGSPGTRQNRRRQLYTQVRESFDGGADRLQMNWEAQEAIWENGRKRNLEDWLPGHAVVFLKPRYQAAIDRRVASLDQELAGDEGVRAMALRGLRERIADYVKAVQESIHADLALEQLRSKYHQLALLEQAVATSGQVRSMRLAVEDQREMFGDRYARGGQYLKQIGLLEGRVAAAWRHLLADEPGAFDDWYRLVQNADDAGQAILLANPLLDFDKLLLVKGRAGFASNWGGPNRLGSEMVVLSPVRPDGELTTVHQGNVSDMDLHWDGKRIVFSDGSAVWELHADGTGLRRVSAEDPPVTHYDACYLPDGRIMCVSNACEQAVPCTGGANVGNLHVMDADGTNERRITFDQDHNWNPTILHDGRVLYSRWEYTDAPHYFSRLLFRMNPDGTGQMEYYGSNSYWPNSMYWPRPIPGHPTMVSCVVSGHHGVSRSGELLLLDPARGRHEAEGAVQRIPGYGKKVEAITLDQLVTDVWPKFAAPWPLADPGTDLGAGKYFLACVQHDQWSSWDLCLVDVFDNITPIQAGGYMTPIPLRPRPKPPVIPSRVDPASDEATIYMADVYAGPGLKGFPRGSIRRLRIGSHHYRFAGNGDTRASSLEGGWDIKKILGTVPVHEDGSAVFQVPANTPIFVQPLDAEGKSQQVMRSWYVGMPGEVGTCVGCHERQNDGSPSKYTVAAFDRQPDQIEPWHGPTRGFSFDREVQPVLDRRCAGCHNGEPYESDGHTVAIADLRAKRLVWANDEQASDDEEDPNAKPKTRDVQPKEYSPAYIALQQYARRPGYEGDYHMPKPAEYNADTSVLVQMLKKGHHNVQLTAEEWERLYTWIDFNVPYPANWRESHRPPRDEQVKLRAVYKKLYANIDDRDEDPLPLPPIAEFEPPRPEPTRPIAPAIEGWPFSAEQAAQMQKLAGTVQKELDLGSGVTMQFALIPAGKFVMGQTDGFADESPQSVVTIERPFYMGRFEVTNAQYACFDPDHDSGVINERWKDRQRRGTPINQPDVPVVRITWQQAMAYCDWLSAKTGIRCTLPTEAQWEWACRAGTATPHYVGELESGVTPFANLADETARRWNHGRAEDGYDDSRMFTVAGGGFAPNAWGLCDMHGNAAEWCLSSYRSYPYDANDGREDPNAPGAKVVRGGSWNDTVSFATSAFRWRYEPYKPVYNVGFRVVCERGATKTIVAAADDH